MLGMASNLEELLRKLLSTNESKNTDELQAVGNGETKDSGFFKSVEGADEIIEPSESAKKDDTGKSTEKKPENMSYFNFLWRP